MKDRFEDEPAVALLTELGRALHLVPTVGTLARRAAEVLAHQGRVVALELGIHRPSTGGLDWVSAPTPRAKDAHSLDNTPPRSGENSDALEAAGPTSRTADARARRIGARRIVTLPLRGARVNGVVLLYLEASRGPSLPWSGITSLLEMGIEHCESIDRLAAGSRHANSARRRLQAEVNELSGGPDIASRSPAMRDARARIDAVATHNTTVLICGESGTGKELFARRVHARSRRRQAPFVAVNCGALPESLIESDLFGHEAGAFTGANTAHVGRFERANGGTLFLDEVGELPIAQQVKLLRVLQEGEIERVGGSAPMQIDVRIAAATNRDLASMVTTGEFREDLLWRLDVFRVDLPPLRERIEDLPLLIRSLLESIGARLDGPVPEVHAEDLAHLASHDWPGNVRELSSVLEEAAILGTAGRLAIRETLGARLGSRSSGTSPRAIPMPAVPTFAEASRSCIRAALTASSGKIYGPDGAASALDLNPSTLQSKMRRLGIESPV